VKPDEIGKMILADHVALRESLERLKGLAGEVLAHGDSRLASLRNEATGFVDALLVHIDWENTNVEPALRAGGTRGREFAAELARDHAEQRDLVEHILLGLADSRRPGCIVARNLLDLGNLLKNDMVDEEEMLLEAGVLPDDVTPSGEVDS